MIDQHPIKAWRERQTPPVSQEALAQKVGVFRETVARWEAGRNPDRDLLPRLIEITGIPARELRPDLAAEAALFSGAAE
jgi:transcriptional regulator with XRE-family HTH domain